MKIALLLSGGVDSSVALRLLKSEGHDLTAFYLKVWLEDDIAFLGNCPWETDLEFVRSVCDQANVPLEIVSLQTEYLDHIVSYAIEELRAGRTPSPDIFCNQRIKFGAFFNAINPDYDCVASGHYARIEPEGEFHLLKRAPDPVKDQTYFLSALNQSHLSRIRFPIGHLYKAEVRKLAEDFDLPNKSRKDSQGICFLGKIRYPDFIKCHLGERSGDIIELDSGTTLGQHQGYWFYTIGQRQGLGLSGGPWYVVRKDIDKNTIYVSHQNNLVDRSRDRFTVSRLNWIAKATREGELQLKLRHGPELLPCRISPCTNERLVVRLSAKDPGIAPGQFAVFYEKDICLGSGMIE